MAIELQYENRDAVPEAFRADSVFNEIFTVKDDGSVVVTGVTGMKTQGDVDTVREALRKEREDHGATKAKLKPWGELDATETLAQLDRIKELEAAAGGKLDEEAINTIVEGRLGQATGPLQRQIEELTANLTASQEENTTLKTAIDTRDRNDGVRKYAAESKVHSTAIADVEMAASVMFEKNDDGKWVTKDGLEGVTAGIDFKGWLREMQKTRPHWWPESEGGGALGGGAGGGGFSGDNPWSHANWNMTEQGKILREQGRDVADRMAKAAGTIVGGLKPPAKK